MSAPLRVLVACERSGAVRSRLRLRGIDAYSCDIDPAEDGDPHHLMMDAVQAATTMRWSVLIAFPDCTYLTGAAEWCYRDDVADRVKPGTLTGAARREARQKALEFVLALWSAPIPVKAIENPVGALSRLWRKPDQTIQPYQFGEDASKRTCLWLDGLPKLCPTGYVMPRMVNGKKRWANQTDSGQNRLAPGATRAMDRARTYPGIADAMTTQWPPYFRGRIAA